MGVLMMHSRGRFFMKYSFFFGEVFHRFIDELTPEVRKQATRNAELRNSTSESLYFHEVFFKYNEKSSLVFVPSEEYFGPA